MLFQEIISGSTENFMGFVMLSILLSELDRFRKSVKNEISFICFDKFNELTTSKPKRRIDR
jgi:hypothetical protein